MAVESELINLITNQGFAIAVAVWLLWERTTVTKQVLSSVEQNISIMERLTAVLDKLEEKLNK